MSSSWRRPLLYAGTLGFVLAVWELLSVTAAVQPLLLASPSDTWDQLRLLAGNGGTVWSALGVTVRETGTAFVVAVAIGVPLGLLAGASRIARAAYEPLLTSLNALPLVVLYPVLAATLGIGSGSKIALAALYAFFPVVIGTLRATGNVDGGLLAAARTMGATRSQRTFNVVAPTVFPPVLASMRVGLGLALVTTIAAEFISGAKGVGYQLGVTSQGLDTPGLFAWIVIACALTVVVNLVFTLCTIAARKGVYR
jgi:NitT/TauT family transport system permease protein